MAEAPVLGPLSTAFLGTLASEAEQPGYELVPIWGSGACQAGTLATSLLRWARPLGLLLGWGNSMTKPRIWALEDKIFIFTGQAMTLTQ